MIEDYRIGGVRRLYFATEPDRMQVPDLVRKCVVFVTSREGGEPGGTAFLLAAKVGPRHVKDYVVAAWHVVEDAVRDALRMPRSQLPEIHWDQIGSTNVFLRVNTIQGVAEVGIPVSAWVRHPDDGVDLAVAAVPHVPGLDCGYYFMSECAFGDVVAQKGIRLGDGVFIVGLFKERSGRQKNIPIVRVGNIAAMPEEKICWGPGGTKEMHA